MINKITKQLAGIEDLAIGTGKVQQKRAGKTVTINKLKIPFQCETVEDMQLLDPAKYPFALVEGTPYIYTEEDLTGISSSLGPGTWVLDKTPAHVIDGALQYVDSIKALLSVQIKDGLHVSVASYHQGRAVLNSTPTGGGTFVYSSTKPKNEHNGGTVIDPDADFPSAWNNQEQLSNWFSSDNVGTGCWVKIYSPSVNIAEFGCVGDFNKTSGTGTDNTIPLQAAIEAAAPFEWKGSVAATKVELGNVKFTLIVPEGLFRITQGLTINPFLQMHGICRGAFFGGKSSAICADFTDKQGSILDAASYNNAGVKARNFLPNRTDWDNGLYTGCMGWELSNFELMVVNGHTIRMGINRAMSVQSKVNSISVTRSGALSRLFVSIRTSVTWGGAIEGCHLVAGMYCLENTNDTTVDVQKDNYLTVNNAMKPVSGDNFTQRNFPAAALVNMSACIYNAFASVHSYSNTCEGADIGMKGTNATACSDEGNFYEAIGIYIYAIHSVSMKAKPHWVLHSNKKFAYVNGGLQAHIDLELSAASYFSVGSVGDISSFTPTGIRVTGGFIANQYNRRVVYKDLSTTDSVNIYLSEDGSDDNHGYTVQAPVLTIQEAIDRTLPDRDNIITIPADTDIATKYNYFDGTNATNKAFSNRNITIVGANKDTSKIAVGMSSNQTHAVNLESGTVSMKNVGVTLPSAGSNYRTFLRTRGVVNYILEASDFQGAEGGTAELFGGQWDIGGTAFIQARNCQFKDLKLVGNAGNGASVMWAENNTGSTFVNVTADESMKIKSKQFV